MDLFFNLFNLITGLFPILEKFFYSNHYRVKKAVLAREASFAFDNVLGYLSQLGFNEEEFCPGEKEQYIEDLILCIKSKDDIYYYLDGELDSFYFDKFNIPDNKRFREFALCAYLLLNKFEKFYNRKRRKEKFLRLFPNKVTALHYMTIQNWPNMTYGSLIEEVEKIKKPKPLPYEKYKWGDVSKVEEEKPTITKAIDIVLKKGKVSERTIINLASSEKLLFIHKYGEGFGNIYNRQKENEGEIKARIADLESGEQGEEKREQLSLAKQELRDLYNGWIRAPIGTVFEKAGFQKLFNHMEGVYVIPLSMLPQKYQNNFDSYISEIIISEAYEYFLELTTDEILFSDFEGGLKYLILAHTISLSELAIFTENREINVSSPILFRMLFTSYLSKDNTNVSSIYINNIVRNVDINTLISGRGKSGDYLERNFEFLKQLLWQSFQIDIQKPITIITLSEQDISNICEQLKEHDDSTRIHYVKKLLIETVDFYKKLNEELDAIKGN